MKLESKKKVNVKNVVFGSEKYLVCVSIKPRNKEELLSDMKEAVRSHPDVVELKLSKYCSIASVVEELRGMSNIAGNTPLILCMNEEGADQTNPDDVRIKVIEDCIKAGLVDIVDIELDAKAAFMDRVKAIVGSNGKKLILSYHGYEGISREGNVNEKALEAQKKGADMVKLFFLANDDVDVIKIANTAKKAKSESRINVPFCMFAIGEVGLMQRVMGDRCGNDFGYYALRGQSEGNLFESFSEYKTLRSIFAVES